MASGRGRNRTRADLGASAAPTLSNPAPAARSATTIRKVRGDTASSPTWPELTLPEWSDTRDTVHMWTQIVGKVRLALEPMVNHWWQVPLYVTARGLTTSLMHFRERGLEIEFDFLDHVLLLRTTDGEVCRVGLRPRTVADFYAETLAVLDRLRVRVPMRARPVEIPESIPFADDDRHGSYDPDAIHRFWLALVQSHRVFTRFRSRYLGKVSPVHFFWGGFDLAVTRFSGRPAPPHPGGIPNAPDWIMRAAYSHEVSSCGFYPGGSAEGSFYSYAYPEPAGFAQWGVAPAAAYYDAALGEFILPYRDVRTADDPDAMLLDFLQSTYEAAAILGGWDRPALEAGRTDEQAASVLAGRESTGG